MKYLALGIIFFYVILAAALSLGHYGVAQNLAQYLFGAAVLLVLIYLIDLKLK